MANETDGTREAALAVIINRGMHWRRVGKGQRFVVDITKGKKTFRTLVKTASYGGAMVRADSVNDDAVISGFGADVEYVLFAVGLRETEEVAAYLVPFNVVEKAYRSSDRRSWEKNRDAGAVWIIQFAGAGDRPSSGFVEKWREYLIGTTGEVRPRQLTRTKKENQPAGAPTKVAEVMAWAKQRVAEIEGVHVDAVKLDLKVQY
jgi:hypothetical protein